MRMSSCARAELDDLLARQGRMAHRRGGVDGEDHGTDPTLAVVGGEVVDGRRAVVVALEVGARTRRAAPGRASSSRASPARRGRACRWRRAMSRSQLIGVVPRAGGGRRPWRRRAVRAGGHVRRPSSCWSMPASSASTPATTAALSSAVHAGVRIVSHHSTIGGPRCSSTWAMPAVAARQVLRGERPEERPAQTGTRRDRTVDVGDATRRPVRPTSTPRARAPPGAGW